MLPALRIAGHSGSVEAVTFCASVQRMGRERRGGPSRAGSVFAARPEQTTSCMCRLKVRQMHREIQSWRVAVRRRIRNRWFARLRVYPYAFDAGWSRLT